MPGRTRGVEETSGKREVKTDYENLSYMLKVQKVNEQVTMGNISRASM